jgi:hypothetical protein
VERYYVDAGAVLWWYLLWLTLCYFVHGSLLTDKGGLDIPPLLADGSSRGGGRWGGIVAIVNWHAWYYTIVSGGMA